MERTKTGFKLFVVGILGVAANFSLAVSLYYISGGFDVFFGAMIWTMAFTLPLLYSFMGATGVVVVGLSQRDMAREAMKEAVKTAVRKKTFVHVLLAMMVPFTLLVIVGGRHPTGLGLTVALILIVVASLVDSAVIEMLREILGRTKKEKRVHHERKISLKPIE